MRIQSKELERTLILALLDRHWPELVSGNTTVSIDVDGQRLCVDTSHLKSMTDSDVERQLTSERYQLLLLRTLVQLHGRQEPLLPPFIKKIVKKSPYHCGEAVDVYFFVCATSPIAAIERTANAGYNLDGHHIESDYDCTGQWFASPVHHKDVSWDNATGCYVIPMSWRLDV
ncbi:hypothetical protein AAFX24_27785 [Vibrio mediterranei]|uniref:hypothetical protein n=1 Tax=Vibrio mediterranei TaxID=689 RepID=UPI0038CDD1B6